MSAHTGRRHDDQHRRTLALSAAGTPLAPRSRWPAQQAPRSVARRGHAAERTPPPRTALTHAPQCMCIPSSCYGNRHGTATKKIPIKKFGAVPGAESDAHAGAEHGGVGGVDTRYAQGRARLLLAAQGRAARRGDWRGPDVLAARNRRRSPTCARRRRGFRWRARSGENGLCTSARRTAVRGGSREGRARVCAGGGAHDC